MEAVLGRKQLYHYEINAMIYAENIVIAYRSRARVNGNEWMEWAGKNPKLAALLADVEKLCQ